MNSEVRAICKCGHSSEYHLTDPNKELGHCSWENECEPEDCKCEAFE